MSKNAPCTVAFFTVFLRNKMSMSNLSNLSKSASNLMGRSASNGNFAQIGKKIQLTNINDPKRREELLNRFNEICKLPLEDQVEFFLKSFIFALGNNWKDVLRLSAAFQKYCRDGGESNMDLNPVQASDFLQKHGLTRTALQRTAEVKDIDLNADNRISFIEYLLIHYKAMILHEFYKRAEKTPEEDLSNGAIGVTGVGMKLLDELFTASIGIDPEVERALEELTAIKKEREKKLKALEEKAAQGGVKGLAAQNEIEQLSREDPTELNRLEITLNAARRRAGKNSSTIALAEKKKHEEDEEKKKLTESRSRLAERAAMFGEVKK